jgi:nucleotide-binding universal stress UspA family protein
MFKHILIPTDGSELSGKAVKAAVELAAAVGAKVTGFFAAPAATPVIYDDLLPVGYVTPEQHEALIKAASRKNLALIEEAARAAGVPVDVVSVTSEYPAESIVETARDRGCDLIFMASHGRRGLKSVLLGSETHKVLVHSKIPVLVYR